MTHVEIKLSEFTGALLLIAAGIFAVKEHAKVKQLEREVEDIQDELERLSERA